MPKLASGKVVTDAQGRWQADVTEKDLAGLRAGVGIPGGTPMAYGPYAPIPADAAKAGTAVVQAK